MQTVNVTELRAHLPNYLNMVQMGEEVAISNRGKIVARLVPDEQTNEQQLAMAQVLKWRGTVITGDIMESFDEVWTADDDNL
jgi:prevent-host-death family protein